METKFADHDTHVRVPPTHKAVHQDHFCQLRGGHG